MRCEALATAPETPPGVVIDSPQNSNAIADQAAAIHNEAFRGSAGFMVETAQQMREHFQDLRLWTATCAATGEVVAYALLEHEEAASWLETVAVALDHQGRGIGAALVTQGCSTLSDERH